MNLKTPNLPILAIILAILISACSNKTIPSSEPTIVEVVEEAEVKEVPEIANADTLVPEYVQDTFLYIEPEVAYSHGTPKNDEITEVEVFYGTDRKQSGATDLEYFYGPDRNRNNPTGPMAYGTCTVTIPPNHKVGNIETPSWWRLEFSSNPKSHIILAAIQPGSKAAFFDKMKAVIGATQRKEAFVFVHGYNVTFEAAAKRTAQIAFDLGFDGAPIMYSWPSRGELSAYTKDESNIQWTEPHLQAFLQDIAERSGASAIHLIAHSMGNRALTRAFANLSETQNQQIKEKFKAVILTAPDIDADVFKNQIAPKMLESEVHITLYASSNDKALLASKELHGNPRAGDSGGQLVILDGIETIDASDANTGFLGHSYFAESRDIITDIFQIFKDGTKAHKRKGLISKQHASGKPYWTVAKTFDGY